MGQRDRKRLDSKGNIVVKTTLSPSKRGGGGGGGGILTHPRIIQIQMNLYRTDFFSPKEMEVSCVNIWGRGGGGGGDRPIRAFYSVLYSNHR